ncbi:MAG: efflux RND transporter permease subunit, partial [bacterium]|nr:efflux RND transporter permease subunit [bacterium]
MSRIIAWFVHNSVAANLLMLVMIVGGLLALPTINQEEFPSIEMDMVQISVEYPGATPEEVEESICRRVEEEIEGTPNIDRLNTMAVEGACVVFVEMVMGSNIDASVNEIESRVNGIDSFPDDAEKPTISKLIVKRRVMQIAISGALTEPDLTRIARRAREEIAALSGVSQVELKYDRPYEIAIEVSEASLRRHGLSLDAIAQAVRTSSLDLPGGSVKSSGGEIMLRTIGQAYEGGEFEDIVVLSRNDGTVVRLHEVANVVDGFEDSDLRATFNAELAMLIEVQFIGEEDILEVAGAVKAWLPDFEASLPEGVVVTVFNDESVDLVARINVLTGNARSGLVLVLLILTCFLRFRLAMWVAAGVPIALLGAIMCFPATGISISTLTVMAFILVLGILVDDAIVIGESIHTHEQKSEGQTEAAIRGTKEVHVPVIFGVLTTVAAFLPLILVPGHMGQFFGVVGWEATLCLLFSLVESQLILPSHLAHRRTRSKKGEPNPVVARWIAFQGGLSGWLERFAKQSYGGLLQRAIEWRYVAFAGALGVLVLTAALFSSGRMRYQFFPPVSGDMVFATLTMPSGIPLDRTEYAVAQLHRSAEELRAELDAEIEGPSIVVHTFGSIGEQLARSGPQPPNSKGGGAHLGEVGLELIPSMERDITTDEVARRWRDINGPIPDAVELAFSTQSFSAGEAVNIELRGGAMDALTSAAADLRAELATYRGVYDIADSFRAGKQEVQLSLRDEAHYLGITQRDLARQVRQSFYGEEAQRIQRGRDDVRVMVRYPEYERTSLGSLEDMHIRTAEGIEVPFAAVADAKLARGFATIRRTDRERVVTVTAEVDRGITTPEEALGEAVKAMPGILAKYPGITHRLGGEQRERSDAMFGLLRGVALALLIIYTLLAIPLRSYTQPFVIMSVIPFGAVGAILGHLLMGWDIVFFSILGIVALSGVVVNASLVMVHTINRL